MARRFQSGLGSEFTRRYKEGQQVDTLMLMSVTKVHYKYNTVDLIALKHKETFTTSYANEGKYSAKLPMEFGGRNIAGQPYGQINPVTVGTIVLVGFVQSDKNNPIILSVYGNNAVTEKLARAPFVSAEPNDESLAKQMYQKFTLYPSLTYDSVDGDGTRVVSFSGKSFIVFDTAPNTNATMISDGNYGTTYEDLGTSFYNDGEVIEPMSGLAPNVLFKHQGVLDSNDEPDNHQFMIHIASDGTYRTSQMNKKEDWRTLFEMTPEGEVRLRRQGDTIRLNDGFQIGELEIDKYGIVRLRNGEMDLEVRSDGLYSQGKPLGESIGGDVDLSEIYDKLNGIDKDIAWANTEITNIGGEVKVVAEKTTIIDGQVKEMESSVSILAEKIETKVSAVEVEEMIDDSLTEVNADIQKAKDEAEKANNMISDMANDNRLTPSEKTDLSAEWEIIKSEYPSYINQANIYEVNSDAYEEAYNKLEDFVEGVLVDMNATMVIDGTQMRNLFKTYYNERIALLNSILKGLKDGITEAMKAASEAQLDATDALANSAQAQIDANRANSLIDDIASDGKLTPSEKTQLKKEWDIIVKEYPKTIQQAVKYKVNTDDLTLKYNTLKNIVEPLLQDLTQTSIVNGQEVRDRMSDYYASKTQVLKDISDLAQDVMTDYGNRINVAETAITQTSEAITLMATKVETIEGDVKANKAQLDVQADQISQKVTASEVKDVVDDAIKDIQVGGTNLFVIYTQTNGWLNEIDGTVGAVQDNSVVSNYIKVRATSPYVASLFNNTGTNTIVICWYDTNRTFISGQAVANTGDFSQQYKSPEGAVYARLSYKRANVTLMKFESGTKATDFSYAWEDIKNDQTLLEQYIKDVEAQAEKAQESADDAKNNADHANQQIDDIANDNILTPSEKQQILLQWEEIKTEYPLNIDQASKFGANATQYTNMYTALDTYLTPILADLTTNSVIVGSTLRTTFKNYYDRRTTLLNNIAEISKTLANNAQNKADQLDDDMNNIGGYNYVGFSSGDGVLPRLMIKNVGYYQVVNSTQTFVDGMVSLKQKTAGTWYGYDVGTSVNTTFSSLADFRMKEVKEGQWLTASANLQVIGSGSANLKIYLYNGGWNSASSQNVTASDGVKRVVVQQKVLANTTGVLVRIQGADTGQTELRFGNVQLEVGIRATPWKKSDIDVKEDINNAIDGIKVYKAWANSEDGTVDFTRVYPNENLMIHASKYTKNAPFVNTAKTPDGAVMLPDAEVVITKAGTYTFNCETDGTWYPHNTEGTDPALKRANIYIRGSKANTSIDVHKGSNGKMPFTFTISEEEATYTWKIRTNTYGNNTVPSNVSFWNFKVEEGSSSTLYLPSPDDDPVKAKMRYQGIGVKDSNNPADYVWSPAGDAVATTGWCNDLTDFEDFTLVYPSPNLQVKSRDVPMSLYSPISGSTASVKSTLTSDGWNTIDLTGVNKLTEVLPAPDNYMAFKAGETITQSLRVMTDANVDLSGRVQFSWFTNGSVAVPTGHLYIDGTIKHLGGKEYVVYSTYTIPAGRDSIGIRMFDMQLSAIQYNTSGTYLKFSKFKIEKGSYTGFITSEAESQKDSKMKYVGTSLVPSSDPRDFVWGLSSEYVDNDKQEQINGKEGTWIYQPIPPSNPSIGLVWVDTTKVPYQPKRYTGTENGWVPLTPEDVSDLPWGDDGSSLADWINQAEQKISATSIVNTVLSSGDFTDLYNTKANTSDLDTLASQSELKAMREEYNRLLKEGIDGIDFTPYVTQSELEQLKDSFNFSIQQAGGVNLLKNSLGFADLSFWAGGQGVTTTQSDSLAALGFGSGFHFLNQRSTLLKQKVTLPKVGDGVKYSLSLYMQVTGEFDPTAKLGARIYEGDTLVTTLGINSEVGQQAYPVGYQQYATVWTPNQEEVTVELFVQNGDSLDIIISGVMLNIGDLALKWQPYPSEIYNTSVRIDLRGITVKNTSTDGYTAITPQEFSGYARVDGQIERIFTLNGQTTEVTALKVDRSITMAPISIFTMNSSTSKGWAFV